MGDEKPDRSARSDASRGNARIGRRSVLRAGGAVVTVLGQGLVGDPARGWSRVPSPDSGTDTVPTEDERRNGDDYEAQHVVADESGAIRFAVPNAWDDVSGMPVEGDPFLVASPDLDGYATSWDVPGIEVSVGQLSRDTPGAELDELTQYGGPCQDGGRQQTRLPGYEFLTQGWFQCGGEGTTFLAMAGSARPDAIGDTRTGPGDEQEARSGDGSNSSSGIVVGAQGITERDLGAIAGAVHSLVTHRPDARGSQPAPRVSEPPATELDGRLTPGESIVAEIPPGTAGHRYAIDDVATGDRVRIDGSRTGGQGLQGFYLVESGERVGFPTAIDAAMSSPYGMNILTGEAGPFTLSGTVRNPESALVLSILPGPFPEGTGSYELTIERTTR